MQIEAGIVLEGRITGIKPFGAFVELEPGVSGLVHISEVSAGFVENIADVLQLGQTVKVKVLSVSPEGKIALSIRKAQPELPIIMVSCPDCRLTEAQKERREIIRATYTHAVEAGDKNVYFIDGSTLTWRFGGDSGTVDGCHPNDLGFYSMAKILIRQLKSLI